MLELFNSLNIELILTYAAAVVAVASVVAAVVPGDTDNKIVSWLAKAVNIAAINFGKATNVTQEQKNIQAYAEKLEAALKEANAPKTGEKPAE